MQTIAHNIRVVPNLFLELLKIMSNNQLIICNICKRDNFKSQRGLTQHLQKNKFCSQKASELTLRNDHAKGGHWQPNCGQVMPNPGANRANDGAMLPNDGQQQGGVSDQQSQRSTGLEMDALQGRENREVMDDDFALDFDDEDNALYDEVIEELRALPPPNEEANEFIPGLLALDQFQEYCLLAEDEFLPLTRHEITAIKLMDILRKKRATLDTYDAVMEWHFRQSGVLSDHESLADTRRYLSRKVMMKRLAHRYNMANKFARTKEVILTSSKAKVAVEWHDARDCVVSLLTDPRFTDDDFVFFNNDPLAPPPDDLDYISDVNTGSAYIETYKKLITKPGKQMLVPILLYIDGAITGQFDKLEIVPLRMSLGIHKNEARDREHAWRTLGYVPNFAKENSRGKKIFAQSGHDAAENYQMELDEEEGTDHKVEKKSGKAEDYHCLLSAILESYRELEKEGMRFDFRYRGKLYKNLELIFFIPFVKCDNDEGDKLCLSYRSRGKGVKQLCRYCLCPNAKTDDPLANYPYKTEPMIKKLVADGKSEKLKDISQQEAKNAFHDLRFGLQNNRGIHGACPVELLHSVYLGVMKYIKDCFFSQIGKTSEIAGEINSLAKLFGELFTRQSDRNMPKTNFAKGIQKGKITAKEFSGVLLVMAAILRSTEGRKKLSRSTKGNFRQPWQIRDWLLLIETILQWEAFLKLPQMQKKHVERTKRKNRFVMYLLKKVGNRTQGMGMKIIKFHAIIHLATDMLMFGVPMIVDTGSNESHHKLAKVAAKLTQKDLRFFEHQTGTRLDEFHLLDLAMQELEGRPLWEYFQGYYEGDVEVVDLLDPNPVMGVAGNSGNLETDDPILDDGDEDLEEDGMQVDPKNTPDVTEDEKKDKVWTCGARIGVYWDEDHGRVRFDFPGSRMANKDDIIMNDDVLAFLFELQEELEPWLDELELRTEHWRNGQVFRAHPRY